MNQIRKRRIILINAAPPRLIEKNFPKQVPVILHVDSTKMKTELLHLLTLASCPARDIDLLRLSDRRESDGHPVGFHCPA